ncbi:hypothetical protein Tco_0631282 [Tanacetum coccineum]
MLGLPRTQQGVDFVFVVVGTLLSNPNSQIFVTEDCDDRSRLEEQHLVVPCSDEEIVKFPTQSATTEISGDNEDESLMMLRSGPNIIKEDLSNDLDGQHSTDKNTMSISTTFNMSDIYEIHSEDVNEDEHSRKSSFKERGNDEDMIQKLAKEFM